MNPPIVGTATFACVFGAALLGMRLRALLPEHHLSTDSKEAVRIGMGLLATMTALLLGLLIASAKSSYDTRKSELIEMAAKIAFLDQALANYGPETQNVRGLLSQAVESAMARIWQESRQRPSSGDSGKSWNTVMPKAIQDLLPKDDAQRTFKAQAAATLAELGQMRCLLLEQVDTSISARVLIVLISWLAIIFGSVGLFAPPNSTVLISLLLVAVSVSVSILLILELDQPFGGLISISSQPIRGVLNHFQ